MKAVGKSLALLCGMTIGGSAVAADDNADASPDADLLEYLGSWEGEDDEWHEFLDSIPPELIENAGDTEIQDGSTTSDSD